VENVDKQIQFSGDEREKNGETHRLWIKILRLSTARKRYKLDWEMCKKVVLELITQKLFTCYTQNVDKSGISCDLL